MLAGIGPMKRYLEGQLRIARETGGEGLIAELVRVEKEGGRISGEEMVAMVFLLLGAGSETTTHLISGSVYELAKAPHLRDWLKQDWSRANLAIEEFLRFVSPVQFTKPRFVRKDIELGGVRLKAGDRIMAMLAAANMDPEANPHPEQLDLQRTAQPPSLVRHGHPFLPRAPARAHRGQVRAASSLQALATPRAGRAGQLDSLAAAAWPQGD